MFRLTIPTSEMVLVWLGAASLHLQAALRLEARPSGCLEPQAVTREAHASFSSQSLLSSRFFPRARKVQVKSCLHLLVSAVDSSSVVIRKHFPGEKQTKKALCLVVRPGMGRYHSSIRNVFRQLWESSWWCWETSVCLAGGELMFSFFSFPSLHVSNLQT